jgi:hypothetical protein
MSVRASQLLIAGILVVLIGAAAWEAFTAFAQQAGPSAASPRVVCAFSTTAQTPVPSHIVEQYKAYLTDLGNLGSRFATGQALYLTIITALIGVLSIKDTARPLQIFVSPASIVVFFFIAAICFLWWERLDYYGRLFGEKFDVLRAIEKQGGLLDVFSIEQCYHGLRLGSRRLLVTESHVIKGLGIVSLLLAFVALFFQIPHFRKKLPEESPPY